MSQALENKIISSTTNTGVEFRFQVDVLIESTETKESETQVFSLGLPNNESIDDFERDMEKLTQNSIKDWND